MEGLLGGLCADRAEVQNKAHAYKYTSGLLLSTEESPSQGEKNHERTIGIEKK